MTQNYPITDVTEAEHLEQSPAKTISEVLGVDPLLPGEPAAGYQQGLQDLIVELGAKSVLQVYLAEKIYECLWWIRRYEEQKRATIIVQMSKESDSEFSFGLTKDQIYLRETLLANEIDEKSNGIARKAGHSIESLRQIAMMKSRDKLQQLDNQIALQTKILAGLQTSYEVAFNRKRNVERLDLQNAIMRRDLGAIEAEPVNDNPKAEGRKQP